MTKPPARKTAPKTKPMLEFRNVHFGYRKSGNGHDSGQTSILNGVSFAVPPHGLMALLGPSGSGKTTILRLALGLEKPDSGEIYINQQLVSDCNFVLPPEKRGLGLLFQDIALFPHMTVYENIAFGLKKRAGKTTALTSLDKKNLVMGLLQQIGLPDFANRYPHQLSGGEQQRVALARALAPGSKLILMDEPFSSLNERTRDDLRDWVLHFLKENNITALMVTHSVEEAMFMSDTMAVLHNKKLQQQGTPHDLYYQPKDQFVAALFGKVNQLKGKIHLGNVMTALGDMLDVAVRDATGEQYRDEQMVDVVIRADAIKLIKDDKKPDGTITAIRFLGHHLLIDWQCYASKNPNGNAPAVAAGWHLHSFMDTDHMNQKYFAVGDRVRAEVDKKGVFIFPSK